jgi:outer membrane usher protein
MTNGLCQLPGKRKNTFASLIQCFSGVLLMASTPLLAREYLFSPSSLEGSALAQQDIDLSLFSKPNAQPLDIIHPISSSIKRGCAMSTYIM